MIISSQYISKLSAHVYDKLRSNLMTYKNSLHLNIHCWGKKFVLFVITEDSMGRQTKFIGKVIRGGRGGSRKKKLLCLCALKIKQTGIRN